MSLEIPHYTFYPSLRIFRSECFIVRDVLGKQRGCDKRNEEDRAKREGGGGQLPWSIPASILGMLKTFSYLFSEQLSGLITMILTFKVGEPGFR